MTRVTVGGGSSVSQGRSPEFASQSEVNTGSLASKAISPSTLKNKNGDTVALTDAATIDLTSDKHTVTINGDRTFTKSFAGDVDLRVTLNATSANLTFPAGYLCRYEGASSGNNILVTTGATSGDKIRIGILEMDGSYDVVAFNMGQ